eukprot:5570121-Lingulodinium_polyedra.AAC.1
MIRGVGVDILTQELDSGFWQIIDNFNLDLARIEVADGTAIRCARLFQHAAAEKAASIDPPMPVQAPEKAGTVDNGAESSGAEDEFDDEEGEESEEVVPAEKDPAWVHETLKIIESIDAEAARQEKMSADVAAAPKPKKQPKKTVDEKEQPKPKERTSGQKNVEATGNSMANTFQAVAQHYA